MALRAKPAVFAPTDGVLSVLSRGDRWREVGSDWSAPATYDVVATCPFASAQMRYVDAMAMGEAASSVTRKVRAQVPTSVDSSACVAIGGSVYEVAKVDRSGRLSWLYLTELVRSGEVFLCSDVVAYDKRGLPSARETRRAGRSVQYQLLKLSLAGEAAPYIGATIRVKVADYVAAAAESGGSVTRAVTDRPKAIMSVKSVAVDGEWATVACEVGEVEASERW